MRNPVSILGIPIDDLDMEQSLGRVEEFIRSGRFHQVATVNVDFVVRALRDGDLKRILQTADLVVPDGMPVVWLARAVGARLPERVTGADMVPRLAELSAQHGYRIFFLGGRPDVLDIALANMQAAYPGVQVCGSYSPPLASLEKMDHEEILRRVEAANPDVLLVAFGNPKQEKWIHMHRHRLKVPVCIGVGGTVDFMAGHVQRAPVWMQRTGVEWLYRLGREPKRLWKRYAWDSVAFGTMAARHLAMVWHGRRIGGRGHIESVRIGDHLVVSIVGRLGQEDLPGFKKLVDDALNSGANVTIDFSQARFAADQALGALVNLCKRAAWVERKITLIGVRGSFRRLLKTGCLDATFAEATTVASALKAEALEPVESIPLQPITVRMP